MAALQVYMQDQNAIKLSVNLQNCANLQSVLTNDCLYKVCLTVHADVKPQHPMHWNMREGCTERLCWLILPTDLLRLNKSALASKPA